MQFERLLMKLSSKIDTSVNEVSFSRMVIDELDNMAKDIEEIVWFNQIDYNSTLFHEIVLLFQAFLDHVDKLILSNIFEDEFCDDEDDLIDSDLFDDFTYDTSEDSSNYANVFHCVEILQNDLYCESIALKIQSQPKLSSQVYIFLMTVQNYFLQICQTVHIRKHFSYCL